MMRFVPTENFDFHTEDGAGVKRLVGSYVKDNEYQCRTPQMEKQAAIWAEEGKVRLFDQPARPPMYTQEG
jgi:hypothetical protein